MLKKLIKLSLNRLYKGRQVIPYCYNMLPIARLFILLGHMLLDIII